MMMYDNPSAIVREEAVDTSNEKVYNISKEEKDLLIDMIYDLEAYSLSLEPEEKKLLDKLNNM